MFKKNTEQFQLQQREDLARQRANATFIGSSNDPFSTPTRNNYQTYPYDYFAGPDCKIFFGDIWVDDIITISYDVSQGKTPIYGYASQNFDAIAKGQVIVQGTLTISFKEVGYLNLIQATLEEQRKRYSAATISKLNNVKAETENMQKYIPGLMDLDHSKAKLDMSYSATGSPQIIRQQQTIEQILADKKGQTNGAVSALNKRMSNSSAEDFEDFAEILEDSIWGDENGHSIGLQNQLKRADEFDYNDKGGIDTAKNLGGYANCLNIMLTFGDLNDYRAEHTMVVLNDVHFLAMGTVVNPNGDPIAESYSFIARDINKTITANSTNVQINPIKFSTGNSANRISRLEDVNKIEDFLNKRSTSNNFNLKIVASYLEGNGWASYNVDLGKITWQSNNIIPFTDQLIKLVEDEINNIPERAITTDPSKYSQLIVDIEFFNTFQNNIPVEYQSDYPVGTNPKITMILNQTIPNTFTYKVVSPTRSGFKANNILTREDIFNTPLPLPVRDTLSKDQQDKNKQKAQQAQIDTPQESEVQVDTTESDKKAQETKETQEKIDIKLENKPLKPITPPTDALSIKTNKVNTNKVDTTKEQNKVYKNESELEKQKRISFEMGVEDAIYENNQRKYKTDRLIEYLKNKEGQKWYIKYNPFIPKELKKIDLKETYEKEDEPFFASHDKKNEVYNIRVPKEISDLNPNVPKRIKLTVVDYIDDPNTPKIDNIKGYVPRPGDRSLLDKITGKGEIIIRRGYARDVAETLSHEYQHLIQYNTLSQSEMDKALEGPYRDRKAEVEARKYAEENRKKFYEYFKSILYEIQKSYDIETATRASLNKEKM